VQAAFEVTLCLLVVEVETWGTQMLLAKEKQEDEVWALRRIEFLLQYLGTPGWKQ